MQHAFGGVRICVCVLIFIAVVKLFIKAVVDWKTLIIFILVTLGSVLIDISPVFFVLAAAAIGIALKAIEGRKK